MFFAYGIFNFPPKKAIIQSICHMGVVDYVIKYASNRGFYFHCYFKTTCSGYSIVYTVFAWYLYVWWIHAIKAWLKSLNDKPMSWSEMKFWWELRMVINGISYSAAHTPHPTPYTPPQPPKHIIHMHMKNVWNGMAWQIISFAIFHAFEFRTNGKTMLMLYWRLQLISDILSEFELKSTLSAPIHMGIGVE